MPKEIISRAEALAKGLKSYFTGKPCVNGHIAERRTKLRHCRACLAEQSLKQRLKNPDQHKRQCREWKEKNRERYAAYTEARKLESKRKARERYLRNSQEIRKKTKEWQKANPLKVRAMNARRRARKKGNGGSHTGEQLAELLEKQNGQCANCIRCIRDDFHADHIMPISLGGSNDIKNIQILCRDCNLEKHAMHPADWARLNGRLI